MKISDLYEALTKTTGTYIGRKLDDVSGQKIMLLQKDLGLGQNQIVKQEDLHVTLMYSYDMLRSDFLPNPKEIISDLSEAYLDWYGEDKTTLVLVLECRKLKTRHDEIAAYGLKHTYQPYSPHVTLAYDVANPESIDLGDGVIPDRLRFIGEYFDELDLDWKKTTK
jgi:hypothetical protein